MKQVVYILNLISTIILGFAIIPLFWCIPITRKSYKVYKYNLQVSTSFAICNLIFVNILSGIILLMDIYSDDNHSNVKITPED